MRYKSILITTVLTVCCLYTTSSFCFAEGAVSEGRFQVKNLKVKSYYKNQQGELVRWADDELIKIDTQTGTVWRWVSERSFDRKNLREYWQEMEENEVPFVEGAR